MYKKHLSVGLFTVLFFVCMALFVKTANARSPKSFPCLHILPGQSIGPVRLGMTLPELKQLEKQGYTIRLENPNLPHIYLVKNLRIILTEGANPMVRFVDATIHPADRLCVRIGDKVIHPARSWLHVAASYGRCEPIEMRTGGNSISCDNKSVMLLKSRSPGFRITVSPVHRSLQTTRCHGYIQRGAGIAAHNQWQQTFPNQPLEVSMQAGKNYCMGRLVLHTRMSPEQIPTMGECTTIRRRGGSIVYCNHSGVALFFAGPYAKLERIQLYHQSHLPLSVQYPPHIKK